MSEAATLTSSHPLTPTPKTSGARSSGDGISSTGEMATPSRLNVLKTKAESRALAETVKVWIVELPIKAANDILIVCKEQIPNSDSVDLSHLRRFAKPNHLPAYLQPPSLSRQSSTDSRRSIASSNSNGSKSSSRSRSRMRRRRSNAASSMHLLICPCSAISFDDLSRMLLEQSCFAVDNFPLHLQDITVPLLAPTSIEQAQQWTTQYWPTLYRKTNPFGPHPSLVARSEEEIQAEAAKYMMLARQVANETATNKTGINCGCVIVERKGEGHGEIIAIAGDARIAGMPDANAAEASWAGNIACHAVMRGIGMIARKRVRVASPKARREPTVEDNASIQPAQLLVKPVVHVKNPHESIGTSLLDYPLTELESSAFDQHNLVPDGYLCVELEIYLTHEPCLMCSMAIVHSRFSRCVFGQRMPESGGMSGESGLGYGLFWRSELNWKLLCWEYTALQGQEMAMLQGGTQA